MIECSQCGKNAIVITNGIPLCVDCFYKFEKIQQMENIRYMQEMNYLVDMAEFTVGMPGILPRYNIQRPTNANDLSKFNYINISGSIVGSLNLGEIKKIDVSMAVFEKSDNEEIIKPLKELTEAIINEKELDRELRNEILEQLSFLSIQANLQKEQRVKKGIIKLIFDRIKTVISTIPALISLWDKLQPLFNKFFS